MRTKRITFKEKGFAKSYVENRGNGTKAALENYNCGSRNMAAVLGVVNLKKQRVLNEIERIMEEKEITDETMIGKLKEGMDANVVSQYQGQATLTEVPDHNTRFKFWEAGAKIKNLFPPTETLNKNFNLDLQLELMPKAEIIDLLKGLLFSLKSGNKKEKQNDKIPV